jgi:hypothetical protein
MRLKPFLLIAILLTLANCAHSNFGENLQTLKGQNIDTAIHYLGLPDNKLTLDDKDLYIWGYQQNYVERSPISTYGGYGSNGPVIGGGIVFGAPYGYDTYRYGCTVKILTNTNKIIEHIEHENTGSGCSKYNQKFPEKTE